MFSFVALLMFLGCCYGNEYKVTQQVYFDVAIGNDTVGKIIIGLFGEIVPKTVKNFYTIATDGIDGKTYAGSRFHRVIKRFMIQGGDMANGDGTGSLSIYGKYFDDENFAIKHSGPGFISMANAGPNTNGCQFFIATIATPWLNGHHTIFGKVLKGQDIVHKIELVKTDSDDLPVNNVTIIKSGSLPTPTPFSVSDETYNVISLMRAGMVPLSLSFAILGFFQYVIHILRKFENFKLHIE